jgi:DNA polymerase elongation subunit (family B)
MNAGKPFRLIDFKTFDATLNSVKYGNQSSSGSEVEEEEGPREPSLFMIQMFGVNEQGQTCSITIHDFNPFFFVRVGDDWTQAHANAFVAFVCNSNRAQWLQKQVVSATIVQYHKLYGFSAGRKDRFIQIVFKNQNAFNRMKGFWYRKDHNGDRRLMTIPFGDFQTQIYESNIPPLLRYFHLKNISPSGWVNVLFNRAHKTSPQTTSCTYEYVVSQKHVIAMPEKETRVPYKIMSFDIEASSSHGDFPMPQKTYKKLAQSMVDIFLKNFADPKTATQKTVAGFIKRVISAAFGHAELDDVDLVYPKRTPTKDQLMRTIEIALTTPFQHMDQVETEDREDKIKLLTIGAMFDKLRETAAATNATTTTGRDDSDADDDDADADTEDAEESSSAYHRHHEVRVEKTATIVDLLLSDKYSRDAKIVKLDEALTLLFPPLKGDEVTFIGSTFMRYGEPEPYMNHCFVVGSCDEVDGVVIETAESEREMLIRWTELVCRENPDIIIGYNIFGFDYEFMFRRATETSCERIFLQLSRRLGELCVKESFAKEGQEPPLDIEHTTIALASGDYDLKYVKTTGRLPIDMYMYLRREYNFGSYKLDDMASYFISDEIKRVEVVADTTHLYSSNLMGLHVGDFIHIEITSFTSDYYAGGAKFEVVDILLNQPPLAGQDKLVNIVVIRGDHQALSSYKNIKWGMAKDDVSPQDIFRLTKGSSADRARVAKYCVQDCNLVHHLFNKVDVLTGYVEMSSICSVPVGFLVFRGQGIKLTSYVAKKCREKETLMPDLEKSGSNEGYEGAIVLPPKCSMYMDNPVACVDYASLYPSSMISQNFSHDSKVWTREYDLRGNLLRETGEKNQATGLYKYDNLPGYQYIDIEFDTFRYVRKTPTSAAVKTKSGTMVCRWAQFPDGRKGIMPSILEELLKARSDTRKKGKSEKDPFMQNVLDKRQLGYKMTANSLYGQCGAKTSSFYEKDVAASTTATGRMMITYARRIIEEVYGDYAYDTKCHGPVLTKAEYVYGDSVASYTPIYIRIGKTAVPFICTIENLAEKCGQGWRQCREPGKQTKEVCEVPGSMDVETWTEKGWTRLHRIIRHKLASHKKMIRVNTRHGLVDATDDHSLLRPDGREVSPNFVAIGDELMHAPLPAELVAGLNIMSVQEYKTQLEAAIAYAQQSATNMIAISQKENGNYVLRKTAVKVAKPFAIVSQQEILYDGLVYDLTTENHHFSAGIGNMVVHNTDSVFFTFNLHDPATGEKVRGQKALEMTIEIAQDAAALCTRFLKPPMELSYEKTLMPFILLKKKRYVGMLYETDPRKGKLKYMGLSIKRRDSCDYLKDVYGGILNILMKENDIMKSVEFLNCRLEDLVAGRVPMDKLTITRALSSYYKNPQTIAHRVLADRIGKRDPGNKPKPGDRLKFVFFENPGAKLQGDKIELPEYIVANRLKIDYTHYIVRQLMKPIQQLYGLGLEQIWEHQKKQVAIRGHRKEVEDLRKQFPDQETFVKKHDDFCSKKVKPLLFDKWLIQLQNQRNNMKDISSFFGKK